MAPMHNSGEATRNNLRNAGCRLLWLSGGSLVISPVRTEMLLSKPSRTHSHTTSESDC